MSTTKLRHGWIVFNEDEPSGRYQMVDPASKELDDAAHTARYSLATLTQAQAYLLCAAVECYQHLGTHPAGTDAMVRKLRAVRRSVRQFGAAEVEE